MFRIKWRYFYIFLLGTYSFLNIKFTQGDTVLNLPITDTALYGIIVLIVLGIWEGNYLIDRINSTYGYKRISYKLLRHFFSSLILLPKSLIEIMADNFAALLMGRQDLPDPAIVEKMASVLRHQSPGTATKKPAKSLETPPAKVD